MRNIYLISIALFNILVGASIHALATFYSLYFLFEPLDILVHGTIMIGITIMMTIYTHRYIVYAGIVSIPIIWELFQFFFISQKAFSTDTITDIIWGILVGVIVYIIITKKQRQQSF